MESNRKKLSTTQIIAIGFISAIAIGTLLLLLPFATAPGCTTTPLDALFTATTSVCVTGLTVVDTFSHWSFWGQLIILLLVQVGGLGIVTLTTSVMLIVGRRVTLRDRLLLESAFNLNTLSGLVRFLRRVLKWAFIVEGIGALCYCLYFMPTHGFFKGLWESVFLSVSAFCNAGMDVSGADSLLPYAPNVWINLVTILLIVMGGLGFTVWWDTARVCRMALDRDIRPQDIFSRMRLHTKLVLASTGSLILLGMVLVLLLEYRNPATIGEMSLGGKLLASLFQSVTLRTAGFFTISQSALRDPTALVCDVFMFIGGSPVGTAGGVKTTTFLMLLLSAAATARGSSDVNIFGRRVSQAVVSKALGVIVISFFALITAIVLLSTVSDGSMTDIAYEVTSAINTVGLSRDLTRTLNSAGRLIIIVCMYLGRIGPISLAIAFTAKKQGRCLLRYSQEDVTVG